VALDGIKNALRNTLQIRKQRKVPPLGDKPFLGAKLVLGEYRMIVLFAMSDELWDWLAAKGWREVRFRNDRRRYREVPREAVTDIFFSHINDRERAHARALAVARFPSAFT
jgi:hypothetical protein